MIGRGQWGERGFVCSEHSGMLNEAGHLNENFILISDIKDCDGQTLQSITQESHPNLVDPIISFLVVFFYFLLFVVDPIDQAAGVCLPCCMQPFILCDI